MRRAFSHRLLAKEYREHAIAPMILLMPAMAERRAGSAGNQPFIRRRVPCLGGSLKDVAAWRIDVKRDSSAVEARATSCRRTSSPGPPLGRPIGIDSALASEREG